MAWASATRPPTLIAWFFIWVICIATLWALNWHLGATAAAIGYVAMFPPLFWLFAYRRLRKWMSPGSRWASGFNDSALILEAPDATAIVNYTKIKRIAAYGPLTILWLKPAGRVGYPSALFPPSAIELIRSHLRQTKTSPP